MTPEEAKIYNQAIKDAVIRYPLGVDAVKALEKKIIVTVDHLGRSTKQEWKVKE